MQCKNGKDNTPMSPRSSSKPSTPAHGDLLSAFNRKQSAPANGDLLTAFNRTHRNSALPDLDTRYTKTETFLKSIKSDSGKVTILNRRSLGSKTMVTRK